VSVWFRVNTGWRPCLEAYEVSKVTEKTVTYKSELGYRPWRENKTAEDHSWFADFETAKLFLLGYVLNELRRAEAAVADYQRLYETTELLEVPHVST